jgi:predicted alternative tryptophan synthase beta-subunit
MAPLLSHVYDLGLLEAVSVAQTKVFEAAQLFVQTEAIVPAPESAHAILAAINEALKAKEEGVSRNILFNLTGHGLLDLGSYDRYLSGQLEDYDHPEEAIAASIARLPKVD